MPAPLVVNPSRSLPAVAPALPAREESESRALRLLMLTALYALPLLVALRPVAFPILEADIWWHLRTGQWVVEHGCVPQVDPFSQVHRPWVAYSWLFEVLVHGLYQAFGLAGIVLYRTLLSLAVVAALHRLVRRREPHFLTATVLTGLGVLAMAMLFNERPWLFTILFSILTLDVLLDLRDRRHSRAVWLLPVCYALWANLHIQVIYGLLLLATACAAPLLDRILRPGEFDREVWRKVILLTLACAGATLLNPYGVRIYGVVLEYASQPAPFQLINELKALEFRETSDWMMLGLVLAAAFALGRRSRLDSFEVLLLAGGVVLAFRARRDMWVAIAAAVAILSRCRREPVSSSDRFSPRPCELALAALLLACLTAGLVWQRDLTPRGLERRVAEVYPVEAARLVAEHGYPGPLFNHLNWGGYLIWSLPQLPVVIDGRTNLHGDERILRLDTVWAGGPGWHDDPDLSTAGVVLAETGTPLASLLDHDPRFHRVHADAIAIVFIRADGLGPPGLALSERR